MGYPELQDFRVFLLSCAGSCTEILFHSIPSDFGYIFALVSPEDL